MKDLFFRENIFEILDYMDEGIHIIDNKGKSVYYNKAAQRLDGINKDDVKGKHILDIYPSLSDETSTLLKVINTREPVFNVEQTFINYKGDKITTINSSVPIIANNKIKGALEISKDITRVRELSEKIVDLQKELLKNDDNKSVDTCDGFKCTFMDIIGQNKTIKELKSLALKAAKTDSPILIYGETGTGKELFVQAIHNTGKRKSKPFVAQNCAALPSNLLESILFGTVKGSFTGAVDRPGLFELANTGTIFLDEINSMPLELQAKLLRVIQNKTIRRLGSLKTTKVDVRIISAVNILPSKAITENTLRNDLYYRLSVINLNIPPLRERKDDIPMLVNYFINKTNVEYNKKTKGVSKEVMEIFMQHKWPGNVRELEHIIEAAISINDIEEIGIEHLPKKFNSSSFSRFDQNKIPSLTSAVRELEESIILQALNESDWNISKTAKLIEIPRQTLQYKIAKYNIRK
ncbi:sigma-54 interaction domain-containing protein [Abyssisolibacter fermentans]|uniref:sigma-54 interaction domain-containing protein n=1 Tax=Abyssisolibacter fermentans TaxID=1766203 RepID=UPI000832E6C4|nr:sigma 54-interacting transcriptional regulator [Abyssisolibacter fermentans]